MRYLICVLALLLSSALYGAEQQFFYSGTLYYNCIARQGYKHATGLFNSGVGLGFEYNYNAIKTSVDTTIGFNLDGANSEKQVGHKGTLDIDFKYFLPVDSSHGLTSWGPIALSWNDYDSLALNRWNGFTGGGINIAPYVNKIIDTSFVFGAAFQYGTYLRDAAFNTNKRNDYALVYVLQGQVIYRPIDKLKFRALWKIMPTYHFFDVTVMTEIGIGLELFRTDSDRKIGADFELVFSVDHYTKPPTSKKKTDYIAGSSITFFM